MKLISIIIPVYNAESTIERCLKPLPVNDPKAEIICIDDGSSDKSGELLDQYAKENSSLKVIHKKNEGAGAARNDGIKAAQGEYLMFCDADDSYSEDVIKTIAADLQEHAPDYLVFNRKTYLLNGKKHTWVRQKDKGPLDVSWQEYLNDHFMDHGHGVVCYNKVYKRTIVESFQVQFEKSLLFGEDTWFNLTYLRHVNSIYLDFSVFYVQYRTAGSICCKGYKDFYALNLECVKRFQEQFPAEAESLKAFLSKYYVTIADSALKRILDGTDDADVKDVFSDPCLKDSCKYLLNMKRQGEIYKRAFWIGRFGKLGYKMRYWTIPKFAALIKK